MTRGGQIFQKSRLHLRILGATSVTRTKFYKENPRFCSDLTITCRCLLGVFELIIQAKTAIILLKILGATVQYLVARVLCSPDQNQISARELTGRQ
jgi:hypothetical protein